ncbi:MAG: transcriptional regulator BetI [Dongiaceae bacterium]
MARLNPVKETRQRQLIDATIRAIGTYGYANTTLSHVAAAAGMSPGIVNFYFKSKEQLLAATLEQIADEYDAVRREAIAAVGTDPAAVIEATIEADFHPAIFTREKIAVWWAFWAEAPSRAGYQQLVAELETRYFDETIVPIRQLIEQRGYRGADPDAIARGLNAMIDGLWFDLLIDPDAISAESAKRICHTYLVALFPRDFGAQGGAGKPLLDAMAPAAETPEAANGLTETDVSGRAAHRKRLSAALKRRLQPQGPLAVKDLATAIGVTPDTVQNWIAESTEPSSWLFGRLMAALDPSFFVELYGPHVEGLRRRFEERLAAAKDAEQRDRAALDLLDPTRRPV